MSIHALFWNIKNFKGDDASRAEKVVQHIRHSRPDVVGFSEIKDKAALRSILQLELSEYDFGITDGDQGIELLAGWKRGGFGQALFTQRREFKAGNSHLRPGSLLSLRQDGVFFNFLFLHTDSGTSDRDYNNRQDMFEKIWSMRSTLSDIENGSSNFVVMGDLNTMGRRKRGGTPAISGQEEIDNLCDDASDANMVLLDKDQPHTWSEVEGDGTLGRRSDLDHVLVSNNLTVGNAGVATVRGWITEASDAERNTFIEEVSDHCSIECIVSAS